MSTPDEAAGSPGSEPPSAWDPPGQRPAGPSGQHPAGAAPPFGAPSNGPPAYGSPAYGPPAYGPPAYGPTPAWGPAPGDEAFGPPGQSEAKAVVALVLSVVSFVVCPLLPAVAALVLASLARRDIEASGGRLTGLGLVKAAQILSWINIALVVLVLLAVAGFAMVGTSTQTVTTY